MRYSEHPEDVKNELSKDFCSELDKIDFLNYDPASRDFMVPLSIGLLWDILCRMDDKIPAHTPKSDIAEEVTGARHYLQRYRESGNTAYRDMAKDELKHARTLSEIHGDESYMEEIDSLTKEV